MEKQSIIELNKQTDIVCKLIKDTPLGELLNPDNNFKTEYNKWLKLIEENKEQVREANLPTTKEK